MRNRHYGSKKYRCDACELEFVTEGRPLHCPRCHSIIKEDGGLSK